MRYYFSFVFLILFVPFLIGCGNGKIRTEPVVGVVTLDGVPLDGAEVNFSPKPSGTGLPAYAITDENGMYKLQTLNGNPGAGTLPGEYIVTISKNKFVPTGRKILEMSSMIEEKKSVSILPEIYRNVEKTPFSVTVVRGKNHFDFDIKSKP
jgi:hypothetical protein